MATETPQATLTKTPTGIQGFDEISNGGFPRGRTILVIGGAGSGKTVFALQSLVNSARQTKERGIFVAFEENTRQIMANAAGFGWDLPALEKRKLFLFDAVLSPQVVKAGEFDVAGMLAVLRAKAERIHATRIVFDGIDVLLSLLNDPALERREIHRIREWLSETGLTGIITQKVGENEAGERYTFLQFMCDCVVRLQHRVVAGSSFRNLRVIKYRGSGFQADEFPFSITAKGIRVSGPGPAELKYKVSNQRISSGLPRLDKMMRGGYHRGSNVLISGAPGTAKSTIAGLFAAAACQRGERALYVSFDEGAAQIVRNLRSVGVELAPHLKSGVLKMYSTRTRGANTESQFADLRENVRAHHPRCLVIDPLSALSVKTIHLGSTDPAQHFLDFLKVEGITVLSTSLMEGLSTEEATATGISTVADTWIHLSYVVQDGERNRALTIVKSRGTGHSNQVRELILTDEGVTLNDVFIAHGKVLMGVARWECEAKEQGARRRTEAAAERKRRQLQLAQAEARARLQAVQTEIEACNAEIATLDDAMGAAVETRRTERATLRKLRHADGEVRSAPVGRPKKAKRPNRRKGAQ